MDSNELNVQYLTNGGVTPGSQSLRLPYFSGPNVVFQGETLGDEELYNNILALNTTAEKISSFRTKEPEKSAPHLSIKLIGSVVELAWNTTSGNTYQLQTSQILMPPEWIDAGAEIAGDGSEKMVVWEAKSDTEHFFRLTIK